MSRSCEKIAAEARGATRAPRVDAVHEGLASGEITGLDVRGAGEYEAGHVPGAKPISRGVPELGLREELAEKDARVVVHSSLGGRGALDARTPREMGYTNVASMEGGRDAQGERGFEEE